MISRLFVLWRTPDERRRFIVGHLWRDQGTYFFAYEADLAEARGGGFALLAEFPEHRQADRPYRSEGYLFSTFAQRVPSPKRSDYRELMGQWQVDRPDDPFEVLARSGGILATDGIELAEYRVAGDDLVTPLRTRIAGTRHYTGSKAAQVGDQVDLVPEPTNGFDHDAVRIVIHGDTIGYIPRCYSAVVSTLLRHHKPIVAKLLRPIALPDDPGRWQLELHAE